MPTIEQARAWYPSSDAVHGFDHVLRVYRLAERLAQAEGADVEIVRAAVLLHDTSGDQRSVVRDQGLVTSDQGMVTGNQEMAMGDKAPVINQQEKGAIPLNNRLDHHQASAEFAGQVLRAEGWPVERIAAVQHCIRAHRFRDDSEQPQTLEAQVLFDADKLDAIGAIGVARAIAYAAQAGQPAYAQPSERFLKTGQKESGEPHSAYHEYIYKLRKLKDRLYTTTAQTLAQERHRMMSEFFARLEAESGEQ
jgi:uncharacterized protein